MINEKRITSIYKLGQGADGAVDVMVTITHSDGSKATLDSIVCFGKKSVTVYQMNSFMEFVRIATYSYITLDRVGLVVNGLIDLTNLLIFDARKADYFFAGDDEILECTTWVDVVEIEKASRGKMLTVLEYLGGFSTTRDILGGCHVTDHQLAIVLDTL